MTEILKLVYMVVWALYIWITVILLFFLITNWLKWWTWGSQSDRDEWKKWFIRVVIWGIILFAIPALFYWLKDKIWLSAIEQRWNSRFEQDLNTRAEKLNINNSSDSSSSLFWK